MTQKTHEQIITEKMKGCGKVVDGGRASNCGDNEFEKGNIKGLHLCPTCKSFIAGYKTALEKELEFLEALKGWRSWAVMSGFAQADILQKIDDIKSALRLLEGMK